MGQYSRGVAIGVFVIFLVLLFSSQPLSAAGKLAISLQLGVKAFYGSGIQNDDFAGTTYLESDTELFLVPNLRGSSSFGGMAGGRLDLGLSFLQAVGLEVGYRTSSHKYSFMDAESESTTASYKNIFCILRIYVLKKRSIQPFLYLSLGSSDLIVKNGSYSYTAPLRVGDAARDAWRENGHKARNMTKKASFFISPPPFIIINRKITKKKQDLNTRD